MKTLQFILKENNTNLIERIVPYEIINNVLEFQFDGYSFCIYKKDNLFIFNRKKDLEEMEIRECQLGATMSLAVDGIPDKIGIDLIDFEYIWNDFQIVVQYKIESEKEDKKIIELTFIN